MDLRQRWIEQTRLSGQIAKKSLRSTLAIAAVFVVLGALAWAVRYRECRASGHTMYHCATLYMNFR